MVNSCVFGVSAVRMQRKERLAALVNTRLTAAQTSAALSIKVEYRTQYAQYMLLSDSLRSLSETYLCVFIRAFSPALPRLLGQAHRA